VKGRRSVCENNQSIQVRTVPNNSVIISFLVIFRRFKVRESNHCLAYHYHISMLVRVPSLGITAQGVEIYDPILPTHNFLSFF